MAGRRIEIRGTVQGVGFRPWVHRLATELGVAGRIRNEARGVLIEAFADEGVLASFLFQLQADGPPAARILEVRVSDIPETTEQGFSIEASSRGSAKALSIPPDLATCKACVEEVLSTTDRRFGYAFTNCTNCGPRFTIATGIPYDRATTTMAPFEMCVECRAEYDDVDDRRFHAQPNACPKCGPLLAFTHLDEDLQLDRDRPIDATIASLERGHIVAVKGLGGFHLACDARNDNTVQRLRKRKHRDQKPFAVMVADLEAAGELADIDSAESKLLESPERPIVLLRLKSGGLLAPSINPDTRLVGLFLPYTPLHHLLVRGAETPLVMTSANVSDEPICKDDEEARRRLDGIADAILSHDREIAMRCDDSVARVLGGVPTILRRSRGFVPRPVPLQRAVAAPVLACGAHLKNTFCIAVDQTAYFGPHIGDLETVAAFEFYGEAIERLQAILEVKPSVIAHDLHPGYLSTRYAKARSGATLIGVQHHHAHVASLVGEHGVEGGVLGVAFDGTGFGADGSSWGGEFLHCMGERYHRHATFRPIPLPGGDAAMREVWRIAYALLHDAFEGAPPVDALSVFDDVSREALRVVDQMIKRSVNAPLAHGVGRYFDAFGAMGLGRARSFHEGQVAIAWDEAASLEPTQGYSFEIDRSRALREIDLRPAVREACGELIEGAPPARVSGRFHQTIIDAAVSVCDELQGELGALPVGLTGGVFQNARILLGIKQNLCNKYEVLQHREVPPGDGGIALGQALIADAVLRDKG